MRVAAKLGYYNVDQMLDSAGEGQLDEWRVFYEQEPFGDEWLQASMIASQVVNTMLAIATAQGGKTVKESDLHQVDAFVPKFTEAATNQDATSVDRFLSVMRNSMGV